MKRHSRNANLPIELIADILSRLPIKSLVRFKCVSNSWQNLINSQEFVKQHEHQTHKSNSGGTCILLGPASLHSFDFCHPHRRATRLYYPVQKDPSDVFQLVGSCNGLVCLKTSSYIVMYNPATRAFKCLPDHKREIKFHKYVRFDKFGLDSSVEDYKILSFITYYGDAYEQIRVETQLYSMKKNSWEIIPNPPWDFKHSFSRSVSAKNSLHWIDPEFLGSPEVIRSFDLSTRLYDETRPPREIKRNTSRLAVFKGDLSLVTDNFDIWILKHDGFMEKKYWSRVFHYDPEKTPSSFQVMLCPTPFFRAEEIEVTSFEKEVDKIACFDLESQVVTEVKLEGLPTEPNGFYAEAWVESLVPLT